MTQQAKEQAPGSGSSNPSDWPTPGTPGWPIPNSTPEPSPIPPAPAAPLDGSPILPVAAGAPGLTSLLFEPSAIHPGGPMQPASGTPDALSTPPTPQPPTDAALVPPAPTKVVRSAVTMQAVGTTGAPLPATGEGGPDCSDRDVLPVVDEDVVVRAWWRRRVFVVSVALALVAGVATVTIAWWQRAHRPLTEVKNLSLIDLGPTYELAWNGPDDVAYQVIATNKNGEHPYDASLFINGGKMARIPAGTDTIDRRTCFIVRSQTAATYYEVSTDEEDLKEQGAQMICITDIQQR